MYVIGIADGHNSSAALMSDGRIIGMAQEERFTQIKNQTGFPKKSIESLVSSHLGGDFTKIDKVVFSSLSLNPYFIALDHYSDFSVHDWVREMHAYWKPFFHGDRSSVENYWRDKIVGKEKLNKFYNFDLGFLETVDKNEALRIFNAEERPSIFSRLFSHTPQVEFLKHHPCHAYYALYGANVRPQDYEKVVVFTADASGDGENWSVSIPNERGLLSCVASGDGQTIARIYKFVTLLLGMKPNEHEYKVMGLSGYGRPSRYVTAVEDIFFDILDFKDGAFVSAKPLVDTYFDLKDRLEGHRFDNISTALQSWASAVTCRWMQFWLQKMGRSMVCFSGGLSMNIKLNGDILALPEVEWLSIPASGGDETLSAGACFADRVAQGLPVTPLDHVYLGGDIKGCDGWDSRLSETPLSSSDFEILHDFGTDKLARLLAADMIVARCAGRAEVGARALGNRSILANPQNAHNLAKINNSVKNRDFWMPFTPSMLEEYANDLLVNPKNIVSPFMTIGFMSQEENRHKIIAALHPGDMSARPQMVSKASNPEYWSLIDSFRALTGVPALLNTSLNLHGDPMNYSLADAVRTVALSDLPCVHTGTSLIYKKEYKDQILSLTA